MLRIILTIMVFWLLNLSFISAQPAPGRSGDGLITTDGDSPLTTSYVWEGKGSAIVLARPFTGIPDIWGTFELWDIPQGSNIIKAIFAVTGWQEEYGNASANFDGNDLGSIPPVTYDRDSVYVLSLYDWDVTSLVSGNDVYPFTGNNLYNSYLAYLIVVFENASFPQARIVINDGTESLQNASSTTGFGDMPPGNGTLIILTEAADDYGELGEFIVFNDDTLAGPDSVFNGNIGDYADYFEFQLDNIQAEDSLTITTGEDWFGIHLALLIGTGTQSDIDQTVNLSSDFRLSGNYPNPFNASTTIGYFLPRPSLVIVEIYDILGRTVDTINRGVQEPGEHRFIWDAQDQPSGLYFYRIHAGERILTDRMTLLK